MKSEPNPVSFRVFLQHPNSKQQSSLHHRIPTYNELLNSSLKGSDVFLSYSCRVGVASLNDFCFLYKRKATPKANLPTFLQPRHFLIFIAIPKELLLVKPRFVQSFIVSECGAILDLRSKIVNVCFCF